MKILGIGFLSESSVSLIENGKLVYAISEERLNRIKNWYGNPYRAIDHVLKTCKLKISDIDFFATHGAISLDKKKKLDLEYQKTINRVKKSKLNKNQKLNQINFLKNRIKHEKFVLFERQYKLIKALKKKYSNIKIFDHHDCHAASAYYFSGFKDCNILTIDGWGDAASCKFYIVKNNKIKLISSTPSFHSLGYFYGSITKSLGFKPHRHEGKILGLAAYGNIKKAPKEINKMIEYDVKSNQFRGRYKLGLYRSNFENPKLNKLIKKYKKEDIASAAQYALERVVLKFINSSKNKIKKLCLAGGVFSNVKLNQKIYETKKISDCFIFPNMGDGGLSTGAAILCSNLNNKIKSKELNSVYLGPKYKISQNLIIKNKSRLKEIQNIDIIDFLAQKLSKDKIIAIYRGRMEFGPRALGNRSIIASSKNKSINNYLNKKLKRTEFMPFAPIVPEDEAEKYFYNIKKAFKCSKFMTMTFKCKKITKKNSPAIVHVDNTARPQTVNSKQNNFLFKLMKKYKLFSGSPILINTSFNIHEEPIVCTPEDAVKGFLESKLDYLVLEDRIFEAKKNDQYYN